MEKKIMTLAAVNVMSWYNNDGTRDKLKKMPLKMQWALRKNMKAIEPLSKDFGDFRDELIAKRNEEWFSEDNGKCERITQEDESGQEQEMLKVKDEFLDDFKAYEDELNKQLNEIMQEENTVEYTPIDLEEFVEAADENDAGIDIDDMDIISIFELPVEELEADIVESE